MSLKTDPQTRRLYWVWADMLSRCRNPNHASYKNYGGRGIAVSDRWLAFTAFLEDMGHPPADYSLDRVNNDADYGPDNCKWSSRYEQNNNRRHCIYVSISGERLSLKQAWRKFAHPSVTYRRAHKRFVEFGWSLEDSLYKPVTTKQTPKEAA